MSLNIFNFQVKEPEDLLIWADLFEDSGFPDHGKVLRWLHANNRWPALVKKGESICRWYPWRRIHHPARAQLEPSLCGFVRGTRYYPNYTLAFLDLINHMVANKNKLL